ncbi:hypothetical protein JCM19238_1240 [Vibrio ponticus]|nr:hypothetical protein JCM19238_1240 [Vibrio ponticus]
MLSNFTSNNDFMKAQCQRLANFADLIKKELTPLVSYS